MHSHEGFSAQLWQKDETNEYMTVDRHCCLQKFTLSVCVCSYSCHQVNKTRAYITVHPKANWTGISAVWGQSMSEECWRKKDLKKLKHIGKLGTGINCAKLPMHARSRPIFRRCSIFIRHTLAELTPSSSIMTSENSANVAINSLMRRRNFRQPSFVLCAYLRLSPSNERNSRKLQLNCINWSW